MRVQPVLPEKMNTDIRYVHDEVAKLIQRAQGPVQMMDADGALTGPFPPMLTYSKFGIPALSFIRSLDTNATLSKKVKEVAILTVGATFGARFELYAHEIMAEYVGFSKSAVASLASGNRPAELNEEEGIAWEMAGVLADGRIVPAATYARATLLLGKEGTAELIFLVGAYALLAVVLNGFDIPAPDRI